MKAAEALGAISSPSSIPVLSKYLLDSERTVRETCEIAIAKIQWDNSDEGKSSHSTSVDSMATP
jgi:deoxyhypusine monooxygenase